MGKSMRVCAHNFRRWATNPRIYVIPALLLIAIWQWVRVPMLTFTRAVDVPVSPWYYPFLAEDWYMSMMIQFGAVLLFCDAPFMNETTAYLCVRAGRRQWFWGQVLYVAAAALIYQVFLAVCCVLCLLPDLTWTAGWGKVLNTLAKTSMEADYGAPLVTRSTILIYSPAQAMALCLLLSWMVTMLFGMLIFAINLYLPRVWGPIVGGMMVLLSAFALNFTRMGLLFFSPGSWMTLSLISNPETGSYPTLTYILTTGGCLLLALTGTAYLLFRRRAVETMPSI